MSALKGRIRGANCGCLIELAVIWLWSWPAWAYLNPLLNSPAPLSDTSLWKSSPKQSQLTPRIAHYLISFLSLNWRIVVHSFFPQTGLPWPYIYIYTYIYSFYMNICKCIVLFSIISYCGRQISLLIPINGDPLHRNPFFQRYSSKNLLSSYSNLNWLISRS